MLSIRFQRTGRRGQAKFRVVVQESRQSPTSGRVVANLGHYDPHTKDHGVDFDQLQVYLKNGAQPSTRVVNLLTTNKIDLPDWVKSPVSRQRSTRYPEKLRRNRPAEDPSVETTVAEPGPGTKEVASESKDSEAADRPGDGETQADTDQADTVDGDKQTDKDQPAKTKTDDEVSAEPAAKTAGKDAGDQPDGDDAAVQPATSAAEDKPASKD